MRTGIEDLPQKITNNWRYKYLNYKPLNRQIEYLQSKSQKYSARQAFSLNEVRYTKSFLLFADPDTHNIAGFLKFVTFLTKVAPGAVFSAVVPFQLKEPLQKICEISIHILPSGPLYYGDKLCDQLESFIEFTNSQVAINLIPNPGLVHLYLLQLSGAPLRITLGSESFGFANITLNTDIYAGYQKIHKQIAALFQFESDSNTSSLSATEKISLINPAKTG